jgi:hypothetical protein
MNSARQVDFLISKENAVALLYSDVTGLQLSICTDLKCDVRFHSVLRETNTTSSKAVIGAFLALTSNSTWIVSFVEQVASATYQAVLIDCLNPFCYAYNEFVVSTWTTTVPRSNSPIFTKVDSLRRPIVGFQAFSRFGSWFEVWRCELTGSCSLQSNHTLEKSISAIQVANRREVSNLGVVLLTGPVTSMFHFLSGSFLAPTPSAPAVDPQPSIETGPETSPFENPDFPASMPPYGPLEPELGAPALENEPSMLPTSPLTAMSETPTSPTLPSFAVFSPTYWYQSALNRISSSDSFISGFQGALIFQRNVPTLALTYSQSNSINAVFRGYCNSTSCATSLFTKNLYSETLSDPVGLPQISMAVLPAGDLLYVIHTSKGALRRVVYSSHTSEASLVDDEFFLGQTAPKPRNTKWDVLGIVGIANAAVATVVVLLALTVFAIHFTVNRMPMDDDPAGWDASRLSSNQRHMLALYYTELKSN